MLVLLTYIQEKVRDGKDHGLMVKQAGQRSEAKKRHPVRWMPLVIGLVWCPLWGQILDFTLNVSV
jgi:hypothetical protein